MEMLRMSSRRKNELRDGKYSNQEHRSQMTKKYKIQVTEIHNWTKEKMIRHDMI